MMQEYDVVVVGGGLAGLTSAAYLCRKGYKTLLCEKRKKLGGLVETFWHQGFAFDAGIRAFENSGILFPMLKNLGIDLEYTKNQVVIGVENQGVKLDSAQSLDRYIAMLTKLFPENATDLVQIKAEIRKVMGYMDVLYGIDNPLFIEKMDSKYLMQTLLPWFFKYQVNIRKASRLTQPIVAYLHRFTKNQALIDMIAQHFFQETPSFFALSYFSLYLDYNYPKGGTGVLPEKMVQYIRSAGGEIMTEAEVRRVDVELRQIELSNGEVIDYKKLVWAANQKTLYSAVENFSSPSFEKQRQVTLQSHGGDSILTLFLGVNRNVSFFQEKCGAHMFYTPKTVGLSSLLSWKESAIISKNALYDWTGQYLERTTYEISCPVMRDTTLAPEGQTGLIISTLFDYSLVKHLSEMGEYEAFKEYASRKIMAVLEEFLLPGLAEDILFSLCATPMTLEKETFNSDGAITGWAFTNAEIPSQNQFSQIAKAVFTPIPNVYQCGQWTFSPSGLPVSVLTGKLAADEVIKALK